MFKGKGLGMLSAMPSSLKRQLIGQLAPVLTQIMRAAHDGMPLQEGEEDFAVLLFQADKTKPEDPLKAVVCTLSDKGEIIRKVRIYDLGDLANQLSKKV